MYAQKVKKQINNNNNNNNNLPRGWIKLSNGSISRFNFNNTNYEDQEYIDYKRFNARANIAMDRIVERFLQYKKKELILQNYSDEEINNILENYTNLDHDGYDYYPCDEDFLSDDESDGDLSDGDIY
tara:strand:+ start:5707 stop:6087 length:381 start_codon:yes stop_codon:yes gene_type:complete